MTGEDDVDPSVAGNGGQGDGDGEPTPLSPPPPPPHPAGNKQQPKGGGGGGGGSGRYRYYALRRTGGGGCVFGSLEDCLRQAEGGDNDDDNARGDDGRGPEFAGFDDLFEASRYAFGDGTSAASRLSSSLEGNARSSSTGVREDQQDTESPTSARKSPKRSRGAAKRTAGVHRDGHVTLDQLRRAGRSNGDIPARLCGDLTRLQLHVESVGRIKHGKPCEVCGLVSYSSCGMCGGPAVHFFPQRGPGTGKACFVEYHSDHFFGLTKGDAIALFGKRKKDWRPPTERAKRLNIDHIAKLKEADL